VTKIPGPEVLQKMTDFTEVAIKAITADLSRDNFIDSVRARGTRNENLVFTIPGYATLGDKEAIVKRCKESNWARVFVRNSDEDGERCSGMVSVTLYTHPE